MVAYMTPSRMQRPVKSWNLDQLIKTKASDSKWRFISNAVMVVGDAGRNAVVVSVAVVRSHTTLKASQMPKT